MFCPKCGSLLRNKQQKNKTIQFCSCGYSSNLKEETTFKETIDHKDDEIHIVEDKDTINPITNAECPKCKHDKAYYWLKQTRAGDEPETKFYKCEKCKYTWREYT